MCAKKSSHTWISGLPKLGNALINGFLLLVFTIIAIKSAQLISMLQRTQHFSSNLLIISTVTLTVILNMWFILSPVNIAAYNTWPASTYSRYASDVTFCLWPSLEIQLISCSVAMKGSQAQLEAVPIERNYLATSHAGSLS